jgi:hypothetical protein
MEVDVELLPKLTLRLERGLDLVLEVANLLLEMGLKLVMDGGLELIGRLETETALELVLRLVLLFGGNAVLK